MVAQVLQKYQYISSNTFLTRRVSLGDSLIQFHSKWILTAAGAPVMVSLPCGSYVHGTGDFLLCCWFCNNGWNCSRGLIPRGCSSDLSCALRRHGRQMIFKYFAFCLACVQISAGSKEKKGTRKNGRKKFFHLNSSTSKIDIICRKGIMRMWRMISQKDNSLLKLSKGSSLGEFSILHIYRYVVY